LADKVNKTWRFLTPAKLTQKLPCNQKPTEKQTKNKSKAKLRSGMVDVFLLLDRMKCDRFIYRQLAESRSLDDASYRSGLRRTLLPKERYGD